MMTYQTPSPSDARRARHGPVSMAKAAQTGRMPT